MSTNTDDLLTVMEAAEAMGTTNRRAVYRAMDRAAAAGHDVSVSLFSRRLVKKSAIPTLLQYFYPYYSEAHQAMVKKWGAMGGTQKKINRTAKR